MTNAEAIEYIKKNCYGEWCEDDWREAMDMAIKALEVQEWIPVSERLPEDVEIFEEYPTVIFSTKDAVYCGFYEYYYGGNWWTEDNYRVDNVVAWKSLPEPYKENT